MDIIISNTGAVPIYEQITRQIKGLILRGELREGEALPSMRTLARDLHISLITTKRAYEELEREGFVATVPGKGCFVAPRNLELARESLMTQIEESLSQAVRLARSGGVSLSELNESLRILYQEEPL
ncbi:GntR family transcriptional regulator [Pseudoflavonifractor phocaeensis]|uniref:GntR family transcriptional regulator n=1 Tax=Pseudoflavonifractor phocaeensis TaxID=1870988 RepID=UPI001957CFC7|nr:GntR family transcriptional regulator [Pseudoflavonifractor phocaeensis]MBM6871269.1 GntR family transcriptional regulator [Pseudoflavonifractor phocaeensis]MBM6938372.1 GntR family transcriptional regulator [Pseudoflavonifractor phocaeensis]